MSASDAELVPAPNAGADWSIARIGRAAGVSSRTLRHYDHLGLLSPSSIGPGGRRRYGPEQLLRLQQIRLLASFGLSLEQIGQVLAERGRDQAALAAAMRMQLERLDEERDRVERRIKAVRATIKTLEEGGQLVAEEMFDGFGSDRYEAEARERWGDAAVDAAQERIRTWSAADAETARSGYPRLHAELSELYESGVPAEDPRTQDLVRRHYELTSLFWTPDADAYAALGRLYVEDERFRRNIGGGNDAVVGYLCDAIQLYADRMRETGTA